MQRLEAWLVYGAHKGRTQGILKNLEKAKKQISF